MSWLVLRKGDGETTAVVAKQGRGEGKLRSWCPSNGSEGYGNINKVPMLPDRSIANANNIAKSKVYSPIISHKS